MFGGYVDIYRRKKYVGGANEGRTRVEDAPTCLVPSSIVS